MLTPTAFWIAPPELKLSVIPAGTRAKEEALQDTTCVSPRLILPVDRFSVILAELVAPPTISRSSVAPLPNTRPGKSKVLAMFRYITAPLPCPEKDTLPAVAADAGVTPPPTIIPPVVWRF